MNPMPSELKCCRQVRPGNSARHFRNPAPVLRHPRIRQILDQHHGAHVIEIGAGCLRNAAHLQERGFRVTAVELPEVAAIFESEYSRFRRMGGTVSHQVGTHRKFKIALATFVFETICDRSLRKRVLESLGKQLERDGILIMSVRGPKDVVTASNAGVRCSDGYLTPNRTFSRGFTRAQAERFLSSCGFRQIEFLHKPRTKEPKLLHLVAGKGGGHGRTT